MEHAALSTLTGWESFYVIIGSAAAALTGLQFVVLVLSAETNALGNGSSTSAFATPTIVHFCAVLLISAIISAPWPTLTSVSLALGICGVVGFGYAMMVVREMRRQTSYEPVLEDWIWHGALPILVYGALLAAAIELPSHPIPSLFVVGGAALLLLFVGIHNAWDAVVYIALRQRQEEAEDQS